ncbi:hypothetical protein SAMN06265219_101498 [Gracilimonas mengyeensis]|uniref:Uncharacterized protein n=1 Tax=Gracilimonas mengyeensis TaxID=1302730 RepID=A0A521B214_9BACT|nr:hypothetical protein SAMN06265219_101498 [Gracilimonas mengyeensis]
MMSALAPNHLLGTRGSSRHYERDIRNEDNPAWNYKTGL